MTLFLKQLLYRFQVLPLQILKPGARSFENIIEILFKGASSYYATTQIRKGNDLRHGVTEGIWVSRNTKMNYLDAP